MNSSPDFLAVRFGAEGDSMRTGFRKTVVPFTDRMQASQQLVDRLSHLRDSPPLVLAVPPGGVPLGRVVADRLDGDLDVVLARSLGTRGDPDRAVGAVDEYGSIHWFEPMPSTGADRLSAEQEARQQLEWIRRRRERYIRLRVPLDPSQRVVIVVDDGLSAYATLCAALLSVRSRNPLRLVCAVPVASPDCLRHLTALADEVICLLTRGTAYVAGDLYRRCELVTDDRVAQLIASASHRAPDLRIHRQGNVAVR
jgi:putative phosphoribosyl transferase